MTIHSFLQLSVDHWESETLKLDAEQTLGSLRNPDPSTITIINLCYLKEHLPPSLKKIEAIQGVRSLTSQNVESNKNKNLLIK